MSRTILIDGDTLIFSATSATEHEEQWDTWEWTLVGRLDEAIDHFQTALGKIVDRLKPTQTIIALSDDRRWRPSVDPGYKSGRVKSRKPCHYKPLREWVQENYRTYIKPTLEGDDVLGILATHPKVIEGEKIVVAIDKDLKQIPGQLYNYDREELTTITLEEADRFFYLQTLMGDVTDGYHGCPGIGPVKAAKILDAAESGQEWAAIVATYEAAGLTEADALRNARVARILRAQDYNYQKGTVRLWNP